MTLKSVVTSSLFFCGLFLMLGFVCLFCWGFFVVWVGGCLYLSNLLSSGNSCIVPCVPYALCFCLFVWFGFNSVAF